MRKNNLFEKQKELVLERFKTLNPDRGILLGNTGDINVKTLIENIKKGDDLGKRAVQAQMRMLKTLTEV